MPHRPGPHRAGQARSQGLLLHSLVAPVWPAADSAQAAKRPPPLTLLGLMDQQFYVPQPVPEAGKPPGGSRPRQGQEREPAL